MQESPRTPEGGQGSERDFGQARRLAFRDDTGLEVKP